MKRARFDHGSPSSSPAQVRHPPPRCDVPRPALPAAGSAGCLGHSQRSAPHARPGGRTARPARRAQRPGRTGCLPDPGPGQLDDRGVPIGIWF
ncbi:hypothetical protein E0504_35420 [Parafrankia sp. BMG5.11]|nr:hypothetical protein E0504_35420 [Parafrankia sp. BMG5.11]